MTLPAFLRKIQEYRKLITRHESHTKAGRYNDAASVKRDINALAKSIDDELPGQIAASEAIRLF